jgi:isopentenyldiphosphate isomerase
VHDPGNDLVDVIDAAGRTVGTVTRRAMREQRLPHRCVYILVFNTSGELFIHQRTTTKDVFPGYWDVAIGGVLAAGEDFAESARREGFEELGVTLEPHALFPFQYHDAATLVRGMVYRAVHDGPFRLQPEEIVRGEFVRLHDVWDRIESDKFCPDGVAALREFAAREAAERPARRLPE